MTADDKPADKPADEPVDGAASDSLDESVSERARFTVEEERAVKTAAVAGEVPLCPRCGVRMSHREIGGGSFGLGYHRQREWLLCPACKRSVMFDRKRGTRL